jgi:hypothetical protein
MNSADLNGELLSKLKAIDYPFVIKNEAGEAIGVYLPIESYRGLQRALAEHVPCPFTEEELQRRRNEEGGCALEELWKKLGVQ